MDPITTFAGSRFVTVDVILFVGLIVSSVIIGIVVGLRGWKTATPSDYFVGGRNMYAVPVGMSLLGGVVSALSVLGNGTEIYYFGTQLWLNLLGCFFGILIVMYLILPVLYPLDLVSMMQYLEMRFHSKYLKKATSIALMLSMAFYLGVCYYTPSLILSAFTNIPHWAAIVGPGLLCTLYISIGGVRGVVYTDVLQTSVMFIGVALVVIFVCIDVGGLGEVFRVASEGNRIEFFNFDFNPTTRHTFWSVNILGIYFVVSSVGISQAQFQRLASVKSLKTAQMVCVGFYFGLIALWSLFYFSGLVAYAAYHSCDPLLTGAITKSDQIVPFMVADKLDILPGMAGLFAAAVYGALLSSVSTQANSFAALVWDDFFADWKWFVHKDFVSPTNCSRIFSALASFLGIGVAFLIGSMGTLFQAAYSLSGSLVSPIDGLFLSAISCPWVNKSGAIVGFISAFVFNIWLAITRIVYNAGKSDMLPLSREECPAINATITEMTTEAIIHSEYTQLEKSYSPFYDISYCYIGTIGVLIVFIVSTTVSIITGPNNPDNVDPRLVHPTCLRIYKRIWRMLKKQPDNLNEKSLCRPPSDLHECRL